MKKIIMALLFLFSLAGQQKVFAQSDELIQLGLNIEKLAQFKQILKDLKKGYQIIEGGYNTIKGISEGNFNLHQAFLDGLSQVSPTVRNYKRTGQIIDYQITLIDEYKKALKRFKGDGNFNDKELGYITGVYDNLFKQSLRNLDELLGVVTAGQMRMSDSERLEAIDRIYIDMQDKLNFLRDFNNNTNILAVQRAKERNDAQSVRKAYGIQ